jgi:AcrR family transcriptional regulator
MLWFAMATATRKKRPRVGRPKGSPPNREAILAAATAYFAEHGYERATIRGIAKKAGVDPALVHHYFGSKDQLLVAALKLPINPREIVPELLAGGTDGLGERLMRRVLMIWGSDWASGGPMVGLLRTSITREDSARMMREFVTRELIGRLAEALEMPQPRLRAALCGCALMGLALGRFVIRLEPIASADPELLIAAMAPTLQRYLTAPLPGDERVARKS